MGDRIEFRCRATETITRFSESDENSEDRDKYRRDMNSSYFQPNAKFYNSARYDKGSARFLVNYSLTGTRKQKIWDFDAWVEPKEPDTDIVSLVTNKFWFSFFDKRSNCLFDILTAKTDIL